MTFPELNVFAFRSFSLSFSLMPLNKGLPLPKTTGFTIIHDHIQVEQLHLPLHAPFTLLPNRQGILDGCLAPQLTLFEQIADMQADILLCGLEQFRHLRLRKPDTFVDKTHFQPRGAIFRLVQKNIALVSLEGSGWVSFSCPGQGWLLQRLEASAVEHQPMEGLFDEVDLVVRVG